MLGEFDLRSAGRTPSEDSCSTGDPPDQWQPLTSCTWLAGSQIKKKSLFEPVITGLQPRITHPLAVYKRTRSSGTLTAYVGRWSGGALVVHRHSAAACDGFQPGPASPSGRPRRRTAFSRPPCLSTMKTKFRRPKKHDNGLPSLNAAINALDLARDTTSLKQAKQAFCSASALLTTTRVGFLPVHICRLSVDIRRTR